MVIESKQIVANNSASFFNKRYHYQLLATFTIHLMTFSHGIGLGWLSPTLHKLQSPDTPVDFSVSISNASWIGAIFGVGSLLGNLIFGILLDKVGRKWCMYLVAIPFMTVWILVYFAKSVAYLYVARFLAGITGGGNYVLVPIFIGDIASPSIRGALSSMAMTFLSFGILVGFVLSSQLDYFLIPCILLALPVVYMLAACMFPETPQHLLRKGKLTEAERSYNFYNNINATTNVSSSAETPPAVPQKTCSDFDALKEIILKGSQSERVRLHDFCKNSTLKAFLTAFVLIALNQFSGSFAFVNYMTTIFAESGSTMDPNMCTIIMGVVQIAGTCTATVLVDRFGRKPLMLVSATGMAVGMIAFGVFTQFATSADLARYNWLPLVLMIFIMFIASFGVIALTFTIVMEIMPAKIRSSATSICMAMMSSMVFVSLKLYPIFIFSFGISITMYSCAGVCIVCVVYLSIFLNETKGKSINTD